MENQNSNPGSFELGFDEKAKQSLRATSVTAGIAAIVSIIGSVLGLVSTIMEKRQVVRSVDIEGFGDATTRESSGGNVVGSVISVLLAALLFYFLNRFSTLTKKGIDGSSQHDTSEGLRNLSSYFKTVGILTIIVIALVLLAILAIGAGRASR